MHRIYFVCNMHTTVCKIPTISDSCTAIGVISCRAFHTDIKFQAVILDYSGFFLANDLPTTSISRVSKSIM